MNPLLRMRIWPSFSPSCGLYEDARPQAHRVKPAAASLLHHVLPPAPHPADPFAILPGPAREVYLVGNVPVFHS
jgi:hypothetical protein